MAYICKWNYLTYLGVIQWVELISLLLTIGNTTNFNDSYMDIKISGSSKKLSMLP